MGKASLLPELARLAESPGLTEFIFPQNPERRHFPKKRRYRRKSERLSQSERTISPEVTCVI